MNTNFHHSPANLLALLQEARRRTDLPPEVPGRIEALLAYAQSGLVSDTCRRYGISRQTFYRWLHRFDARDLLSLADHPKFFAKPAPAPVAPIPELALTGAPAWKSSLLTGSLALNILLAGIGVGLLLGRSLLPPATPASLIEQSPLPAPVRRSINEGGGEGQGEGTVKTTGTGATTSSSISFPQ